MRVDNLKADRSRDIVTRVEDLERATPLNNASIGRNGLRVHSGGVITIQNGGLSVTGTAEVIGELIGSGALTWTGPTNFEGPVVIDGETTINGDTSITGVTTISGPLNIIGAVDITDDLDITGNTTITGTTSLQDDLVVSGGGKIIAGGLVLSPTGGAFGGGALTATAGITLSAPLTVITGGLSVDGNTVLAGDLTNSGLDSTTSPANVYVNSSGQFHRITSASRFKIDPQESVVADAVLDVPVKDWIDAREAERIAELLTAPRPFTQSQQLQWDAASFRRVPGVIAEEVEAAGGELFVTYDPDGIIQGVAYDRLAIARTQVLAQRLADALERIEKLEARL